MADAQTNILTRFDDLNVWKQGDQRAPHKPLLVLYALGRWQQGNADVTFKEAEPDLTALLREFGPPRKSDHPEQPFWRLQKDGVWIVKAAADLPLKTGDDIPRVGALRVRRDSCTWRRTAFSTRRRRPGRRNHPSSSVRKAD